MYMLVACLAVVVIATRGVAAAAIQIPRLDGSPHTRSWLSRRVDGVPPRRAEKRSAAKFATRFGILLCV